MNGISAPPKVAPIDMPWLVELLWWLVVMIFVALVVRAAAYWVPYWVAKGIRDGIASAEAESAGRVNGGEG